MKIFALAGMLLLMAPAAFAGWVSGGGELARDATNPWFIQNTKVIRACIEVDAEHFHRPDGALSIQQTIETAIKYWSGQFIGQTTDGTEFKNYPMIATQPWTFSECEADTDVRFQFGTLTVAQLQKFKEQGQDPRNFISIAVRTDYDPVNLRGKGFIYVAADSGLLKPIDPSVVNQPWAKGEGGILTKVLAHELGHVYGLPHTSSNGVSYLSSHQLMDAIFPEAIVKDGFYMLNTGNDIPRFFSLDTTETGSCFATPFHWPEVSLKFLAAPSDTLCIQQKRKNDKIELRATSELEPDSEKWPRLGTITLIGNPIVKNFDWPMRIWLPPGQTVVGVPNGYKLNELPIGLHRNSYQQHGIYRDVKNTVRQHVIVTTLPGQRNIFAGILPSGELINIPPYD